MRRVQILAIVLLAVALAYAGFRFTNNYGLRDETPTYVISDIYSLIPVINKNGYCQVVVGYREKHVIGTFVVVPVKKVLCHEYYFQEDPSSKYHNVMVVLVRLNTGEYHWVLEDLLVTPVQK